MDSTNAIKRAIAAAGGGVALAKRLGVTPQAVHQWTRDGVPPKRVVAVELATGGAVTRQELRPDIFGSVKAGIPQGEAA